MLTEGLAAKSTGIPEGAERPPLIGHPTGEFTVIARLDEHSALFLAGGLSAARKLADAPYSSGALE